MKANYKNKLHITLMVFYVFKFCDNFVGTYYGFNFKAGNNFDFPSVSSDPNYCSELLISIMITECSLNIYFNKQDPMINKPDAIPPIGIIPLFHENFHNF